MNKQAHVVSIARHTLSSVAQKPLTEESTIRMFHNKTFIMPDEDDEDDFAVDNDAKLRCDLFQKFDANNNQYYTGKLQFNGDLDLKDGQSFMIFLSDEGTEEIQIGPLEPHRLANSGSESKYKNGRLCIRLRRHFDSSDKPFYVGEVHGIAKINCKRGIFFTIFTSIDGREELQIAQLDQAKIKRKRSDKIL